MTPEEFIDNLPTGNWMVTIGDKIRLWSIGAESENEWLTCPINAGCGALGSYDAVGRGMAAGLTSEDCWDIMAAADRKTSPDGRVNGLRKRMLTKLGLA